MSKKHPIITTTTTDCYECSELKGSRKDTKRLLKMIFNTFLILRQELQIHLRLGECLQVHPAVSKDAKLSGVSTQGLAYIFVQFKDSRVTRLYNVYEESVIAIVPVGLQGSL